MAKINPWKVTGYKAGQNVACKVNYAEKDGYAVTIQKDNLPGFIKTANALKAGDEILGVFVCVHEGRILLQQLFSAPRATAHQLAKNAVNWEEHMNDDTLDQAYEQQAQTQRNQRLGLSDDSSSFQAPQTPSDIGQYSDGAGGQGQAIALPANSSYEDAMGFGQGASNQQYANQEGGGDQSYQNQGAASSQMPYQSGDQNAGAQYDAPALPNPQQNPWASPQQAQYESGTPAQYESGAQGQYESGQQAQYESGQQPQAYQQEQNQNNQNAMFQPPAVIPSQNMPQAGVDQQWESPHSQVPTKRFRLRRAIDLVMPPVDEEGLEGLKSFKIADYDMEWLITDLEGGMRTGCIKATSEQKLSRSAALLYRGRAVGCIYGCKANPDAKPTEESLSAMLSDLEAPDAVVTLYDLPEDVTIAMSALFLGYPIDTDPRMSAREYSDFVMKWFAENGSTACLAVTVPQTKSTYLVFVHKGKFAGAFFVEEQQFTRDANEILNMFNKYPDARIEASLLNAETLNSGMRFGYSLTMARKKGSGF